MDETDDGLNVIYTRCRRCYRCARDLLFELLGIKICKMACKEQHRKDAVCMNVSQNL